MWLVRHRVGWWQQFCWICGAIRHYGNWNSAIWQEIAMNSTILTSELTGFHPPARDCKATKVEIDRTNDNGEMDSWGVSPCHWQHWSYILTLNVWCDAKTRRYKLDIWVQVMLFVMKPIPRVKTQWDPGRLQVISWLSYLFTQTIFSRDYNPATYTWLSYIILIGFTDVKPLTINQSIDQ